MRLFNVLSNKNKGFTLIENLIIGVIVGILAAISAPSFLGMDSQFQVNDAVNKVRGALQEAQSEAIRKSESCKVTLNTANKKITATTLTAPTKSCLVTGDRILQDKVTMAVTNDTEITYNFRGTTNNSSTIRIAPVQGSGTTKCVVIFPPLGIIKTGIYDVNANYSCRTEQ